MATARDLIRQAMLKIGAISGLGQAPTSDEASDALLALNQMIGGWSNDSVNIVARYWEFFPLTANVDTYTIGSKTSEINFNCKPCCEDPDTEPEAEDLTHFETERPVQILPGSFVRQRTVDYRLALVSDETYNRIGFKQITGIPNSINYDNGFPIAKLRIYPRPIEGMELFLLSEKPIKKINKLDDILELPTGWEEAIIYNLAIRLAPEYNQPVPPQVEKIANDSLGAIRRAIIKNRNLDANPNRGNRANIYSGYY